MRTYPITIYEIAEIVEEKQPYFFKNNTFFGQTMESFAVVEQSDGRYRISAPIIDRNGKNQGETIRYFNPETNDLESK